jgi:hypothetical protein
LYPATSANLVVGRSASVISAFDRPKTAEAAGERALRRAPGPGEERDDQARWEHADQNCEPARARRADLPGDVRVVGLQLLFELAVAQRRGDLAGEVRAVGQRAADRAFVVDVDRRDLPLWTAGQ